MAAVIDRERWALYKTTIEDCLREGFAPYRARGVGGKGSAVQEAGRRLGIVSLGGMAQWVRSQERLALERRENSRPDWSLFCPSGTVVIASTPTERRDARDAGFWKKQVKDLQKSLSATEHLLDEVRGLQSRLASPALWTLPSKQGGASRVAGLLHLSDFHCGEKVRGVEIGGLNDYDPDIFIRRLRRCFAATLELLPRWSADSQLEGIVLAINGDLVSGDIHDELRRTNALTAHEQVYLVTDEIAGGIRLFREAGHKLKVVFTPGNHGRSTEKTHAKRVASLSYDTMIGEQVRRAFATDTEIEFLIAQGTDAVYPVLGWNCIQSHGDALGTGGGKGFAGPVLPILRGAKNVEAQGARTGNHYDIKLTAHYHTSANPGSGILANGSVVGFNEFANRIRATYEVPQQWLALVHERWCLRERCELKLEDPQPPATMRFRVPAGGGRL